MELNLSGKKALVTGSSSGIGFSIAETLHREGCVLFLNGRDDEKLKYASSKLKGSHPIAADVSSPQESRRLVSEVVGKLGGLDVLICNVGSGSSVAPGKETFEEWQRVFSLNLWSATNVIEAAQSALIESKGVVVCISSICGMEVVPGAPLTYSAAKAALNSYVKGLARPLGKKGIRINAVAPGNILFESSSWSKKLTEDKEAVNQMIKKEVSLSKFGKPQDVANLVAYLASSQAEYATGGIWTLDGGQIRS